jgi:hypothetical protein
MKLKLLALTCAFAAAPAGAWAGDFCAQMKALADAAPAGFPALRSGPPDSGGSWHVATVPGGATGCSIFPKSPEQGPWMSCDIDGYPRWKAALSACFPGVAAATAKDQMGTSTTFTFDHATLAVDDSNGLTVETR